MAVVWFIRQNSCQTARPWGDYSLPAFYVKIYIYDIGTI